MKIIIEFSIGISSNIITIKYNILLKVAYSIVK